MGSRIQHWHGGRVTGTVRHRGRGEQQNDLVTRRVSWDSQRSPGMEEPQGRGPRKGRERMVWSTDRDLVSVSHTECISRLPHFSQVKRTCKGHTHPFSEMLGLYRVTIRFKTF